MNELPRELQHLVFDYLQKNTFDIIEKELYAKLLLSSYQKIYCSIQYNQGFEVLERINKKRLRLLKINADDGCITNCNRICKYFPIGLNHLTELRCYCCTELTEIPKELIHLTRLDCFRCDKLLEFPKELVNLTELSCTCCQSIRCIPKEFTNLTILECSYCSKILDIPRELVNLTKLNCTACDKITEIPHEFVHLTKLHCLSCSVTRIPKTFVNLTTLAYWTPLENIPIELVNLTEISDGFSCTKVKLINDKFVEIINPNPFFSH